MVGTGHNGWNPLSATLFFLSWRNFMRSVARPVVAQDGASGMKSSLSKQHESLGCCVCPSLRIIVRPNAMLHAWQLQQLLRPR